MSMPRLPSLLIGFLLVGLLAASGEVKLLTTSDIETLCKNAAEDAKDVLQVALDVGEKFRSDQTVWALGIENRSKTWRFSRDEFENKERGHQLSIKLGRALATPGRIRTEYFTVASGSPSDTVWQRLSAMLQNPKDKWIDEKTRISSGIGWVVYGYLLDVPNREKPYAIIKLIDVKDRVLLWGGCFSMNRTESGHRNNVLYPVTRKIASSLIVPAWAKPAPGAFMASTYWFRDRGTTGGDEDVFADLLVLQFLRSKTLRPQSRWLDPPLIKRYAVQAEKALAAKKGKGAKVNDYEILAELHRQPEWQSLESVISGEVVLESPKVSSALLKCIKIARAEKESLDSFVLSGYCSESLDYAGRRDWVRRAVELGLQGSFKKTRLLRVAPTSGFEDERVFREIVEIAVAQPAIASCRVLDGKAGGGSKPDYDIVAMTGENKPSNSLYIFLTDLKNNSLSWARTQIRPGKKNPDPTYQEYCSKLQKSIRGGAANYGSFPCILWYLSPGKEDRVGTWAVQTAGQELAVTLIDPSRPFIHSIGGKLFGRGGYAQLIQASKIEQARHQKPIRVIVFQLLERSADSRPALVVKVVDPSNGRIEYAYYDEPAGTPLPVQEEDHLLERIHRAVEDLMAGGSTSRHSALVTGFNDNQLLKLGRRSYELLVTRLAVRRQLPPVEWDYFVASDPSLSKAKPKDIFLTKMAAALKKLQIGSVIHTEWVPSNRASERYPQMEPRQLLLWETLPSTMSVDRFAACPSAEELAQAGTTRFLANQFLHMALRSCMRGVKNSFSWETLQELSQNSAVFHRVLKYALSDYESDPNLTQNIVILDTEGNQLVSTGTSEKTATAGNGFSGILADAVLTASGAETSLVGIQDVEIVQTKGIGKRAGKSRVGALYPPDWRGTYPSGESVLGIPVRTAILLVRRNMEYMFRKAGFGVIDTLALRNRHAAENMSEFKDPAAVPGQLLKKLAAELEYQTVQIGLKFRHQRMFPFEGLDGKMYLVHSVTILPSTEIIHPRQQLLGSLPDAIRFFLIQKDQAGAGGYTERLAGGPLREAGAADLIEARNLWENGSRVKARAKWEKLAKDLKLWSDGFTVFKTIVQEQVAKLVDEMTRFELEYIRELRKKVVSSRDQSNLQTVRAFSGGLIDKLGQWGSLYPQIAPRQQEIALQLAMDAVDIHSKAVYGELESAALDVATQVLHVEETDAKLKTARFIAGELIKDLKDIGVAAGNEKEIVKATSSRIDALGARMIEVGKNRANQIFPTTHKLKSKQKLLKKKIYVSLREYLDASLSDLETWSKVFPSLADLQKFENRRTAWKTKEWRKRKPVNPATARDAITALDDEIKKIK